MENKNNQKKMYWLGGGLAALVVVALVVGTAGGLFQGALFPNLKLSAPSKVMTSDSITKLTIPDGVAKLYYGSVPPSSNNAKRSFFADQIAARYKALGKGTPTASKLGCATDAVGSTSENSICWLIENGYANLKPDKTFGVNDSITRAEAAKMFYQVFISKTTAPSPGNQLYKDVENAAWYAGYVNGLALLKKVDIIPNTSDLNKSYFYPEYSMSMARTSNWLNKF